MNFIESVQKEQQKDFTNGNKVLGWRQGKLVQLIDGVPVSFKLSYDELVEDVWEVVDEDKEWNLAEQQLGVDVDEEPVLFKDEPAVKKCRDLLIKFSSEQIQESKKNTTDDIPNKYYHKGFQMGILVQSLEEKKRFGDL